MKLHIVYEVGLLTGDTQRTFRYSEIVTGELGDVPAITLERDLKKQNAEAKDAMSDAGAMATVSIARWEIL